jgi:hypothetical protein
MQHGMVALHINHIHNLYSSENMTQGDRIKHDDDDDDNDDDVICNQKK